MNVFDLIKFGIIFVGLCFTVVLGIIFTNVFIYSYKPRNAIIFIALIVGFFFFCGILAYLNFGELINEIKLQLGVPTTPNQLRI